MNKIPFAKLLQLKGPLFATGRKPNKMAPGQTETEAGSPAPHSVIQAASPDDVLRVTKQPRKNVILVTPFMAENPRVAAMCQRYAMRAVKDSIAKSEAPLAFHAFYYEVLNVRNPIERDIGLQSQISWVKGCERVVVYVDLGITPAMQVVINAAQTKSKPVEYRTIGDYA